MKPSETQLRLSESINQIIAAANENNKEVDITSEPAKVLMRKFYDLLQQGFVAKSSEETDAKLLDYIRNFLGSQNEFFISHYVDTYSQGKQIEKKVAGLIILMFQERLLSEFFVKLMGDKDFKTNYSEQAALLDPRFIFWLIEELQRLESQKINLKSKWVEAYVAKRGGNKDRRPKFNFEDTPVPKSQLDKIEKLETLTDVPMTDIVKSYITEQKKLNISDFESATKEKFRSAMRSQSQHKVDLSTPFSSKNSVASTPQKVNQFYNSVLARNMQAASETGSLDESRDMFVSEDEMTVQTITAKYIMPHLLFADKLTAPPADSKAPSLAKSSAQFASGDKCPDCSTELTSSFFGVKLSEKLSLLRAGNDELLQELHLLGKDSCAKAGNQKLRFFVIFCVENRLE